MPKKDAPPPSMHDLIAAKYGSEAVTPIDTDEVRSLPHGVISTRSLALNDAIGTNGWPRGRIVEIYGPESSGKTTLCLHAIAEAQSQGLSAAFLDVEHAIDLEYAQALGVDLSTLLMSQPDSAEQTAEMIVTLAESGVCDLIVVDSIAGMTPEAELVEKGTAPRGRGDGVTGKVQPGSHAKLMSRLMRRLSKACNKSGCCCLFINQTRSKIGVMMGSPETRPGGNATKFFASMILRVVRVGNLKQGDTEVAGRFEAKVRKNKLAAPFRKAEYLIGFGIEGACLRVDREREIVNYGVEHNVFQKRGANIYYHPDCEPLGELRDTRIECGALRVANALRANPHVRDYVAELVGARMRGEPDPAPIQLPEPSGG